MAAATVTGRRQSNISGNRREVFASSVAFAASGDTWSTGLKLVEVISLTPTTNASYGFTIAGGTITLTSGGALTFAGKVEGI